MSKKPATPSALFAEAAPRRRRVLILPRFLAEEADKQAHRDDGPDLDNARTILAKWAGMESKGLLRKKESALDANFLIDVFGTALRYTPVEQAAPDGSFTLDRQLTVPGVGPADGALGFFPPKDPQNPKPLAVIELKGSDTDLDTDKSAGRTPVQQLFDYLNGLPDTHWGILSNLSTIRLYHKDSGSQAYEEFSLQKLKSDPAHFAAFWCLFEKSALLPTAFAPARADALLTQTGERKKEVAESLRVHYVSSRAALIADLRCALHPPFDDATRIAQKILDRVVFIAFCQDSGFFPPDCFHRCLHQFRMFDDSPNRRWQNIQNLFLAIHCGHHELQRDEGVPVDLFCPDAEIAAVQLSDKWTERLAADPPLPPTEADLTYLAPEFPGAIAALRQTIPHDIDAGTFADNSRRRTSSVDIIRHLANNEAV